MDIKKDHKKQIKIKNQEQQEDKRKKWPSERLQQSVERIGVRERRFEFNLEESHDVTEESVDLAEKFQPKIELEGVELRSEKHNSYAGYLWRAAEDEKGLNRVLQFIYIWTKQKLNVSPYYMSLPTFLLGILGITLLTFIDTLEYFYVQLLSIALIGTGFILVGLYRFISDIIKTRGLTLSYSYWFVAWGVIFNLLIAEIIYKNYQVIQRIGEFEREEQILHEREVFLIDSLFSKYLTFHIDLPFWDFPLNIFIPMISMVLFGIAIICLILSIWSPQLPLASHSMDYAPVYVYLTRSSVEESYELDAVRYDRYHYFTDTITFTDSLNYRYLTLDKKSVQLKIDNSWHSLALHQGHLLRYSMGGLIVGIISMLAFFASFIIPSDSVLSFLSIQSTSGPIIAFIVLPIIIFIATFLVFAKHPTKLADLAVSDEKTQLTYEKMVKLWNLKDEHASLKIRRKLQAPFRVDPDFWKDFRDHLDEILYLDVLPRLVQLERKLQKLE